MLTPPGSEIAGTWSGSAPDCVCSSTCPPEPEPEPEPEPRLVAYVTLSEGIRSSSWETGGAEVAVWVACRRQLPAHSVPTQFVRLD